MTEALLQVRGLVKRFGGLIATNQLDLDVRPGETLALIGPNGAGKTSLIAQLQGDLTPDAGTIRFAGRDITREAAHRRAHLGLARSFQITSVFPEFNLLGNVAVAVQACRGHSFRFWRDARRDPELTMPAREALDAVGLGEPERRAADVSHGERRQLELAMALAMQPKLLLLDEPMAGMGREDSARMTQLLEQLKRRYAILLVEHDMNAVFALADRVAVLVAGRAIASGAPDEVRRDPDVRAAYLGHR
ncbi:ABC transporter ATP-binding protein [Bradyrhizobium sp. WD16]|uniref:ABC transporter ATP-binding protein n=1 Tax=Bradyrhizobium sp. WD16 TaxID=1521768 RepID=UPI0020A50E8C|nr:ABC transporter ATP-binding protein [Bradyrhizobium sp. WD16]UTD25715.1 ABC transporter ATP-binding protein [Bradyrhizobium sp. WD16]